MLLLKEYLQKWQMASLDTAEDEIEEPVFRQYRHNAKGAIAALKAAGAGVAIAALYHPQIGDIDLRWGHTSENPRAKGAGLAKIMRWHPEVVGDLQGFISSLKIHQIHRKKDEIHLTDGKNARAGIKLSWNKKSGHWLVTAYIRGASASKGLTAVFDARPQPTTAPCSNASAGSVARVAVYFESWYER